MKFLIAIKNISDESKNILEIGCKIAEGFSADLTICYVGKKSKALIEGDVNLARLSMAEWNIYHPGLEVLEWAFNILKEKEFAPDTTFDVQNLVEDKERIRLVLPKTTNYQIRLVLREGELLTELNKEVKQGTFDIAILGSPKRKRMTQKIAQFLDTSIFFVKNFNPSWDYKILLCVDDSRATKRAVILSTRISKQFSADITSVTVSKTSFFGKGPFKILIFLSLVILKYSPLIKSSGQPARDCSNPGRQSHMLHSLINVKLIVLKKFG